MVFRVLIFLSLSIVSPVWGVDLDAAPIHYRTSEPSDRFAKLKARIDSGDFELAATGREALRQILEELEVPIESQVLVFSKTSAQNSLIRPSHPRAIYFSDDSYVGWVQGGSIEILSYDPEIGAVFYLVDPFDPNQRSPQIERPITCLNCHQRSSTHNAPGGLVRSVFAQHDGMPIFHAGSHYVDDETALADRWGGWYTTGSVGEQTHLGNAIASENEDGVSLKPVVANHLALRSLDPVFDTRPYLAGGSSDVLALMVLEHQVSMHNLLSSSSLSVRQLIFRTNAMKQSMGEPALTAPVGTVKRVIDSQASKIVRKLLFRNEHQMKGDGVDGGEAFQEAFAQNRRPSSEDRALKDLRLYERMFKYRCSYVIYSEVFDHLTPWLKEAVYLQLSNALRSEDDNDLSGHLSLTERQRILAILQETKEDWPAGR